MNNFYKGGRELAYLKGLPHYAVQQKNTVIRQHLQIALQGFVLANAIMFIDPITLLCKLWKSKAILLLGIALLPMFSLSAQTPRKYSGADELKEIMPLSVGEQMPEYFWDREYLFYENGDTTRRSISEFKGKLLVLDFWATWCAICIGQMKETESLFSKYPNNVKLLFVNPTQTKDNYGKILKIQNRLSNFSLTGRFISIIEDDYLNQLFPNHIYPRYAWIGPYGDLIALTTSLSVTSGHVDQILNLLNMNNEIK